MTTASARLVTLSGLAGSSAAAQLRQIAGFYGSASAMLVAYSGLPSATAAQHLLTDHAPATGTDHHDSTMIATVGRLMSRT